MKTNSHVLRGRAYFVAGTALALALVAGGLGSVAMGAPEDGKATRAPIDVANALSSAFRSAAARIGPSVVSIQVTKSGGDTVGLGIGQIPDEFRRFFQGLPPNAFPRQERGRSHQAPKAQGEGSGVIVSEDGRILTNNHVVEGADSIRVKLADGTEYEGKVIGTDSESDLAVIRIEASGLTPASIGDSDTLLPGDWVVAVGSPFGLDHTVTAGIVSATGRADMGLNTFEDFIQTDAAVNPGNSGGPLINLKGEVVGINTAIRTGGGMGSDGVGFAIPSSTFKGVMDSLIADGKVERGWLGVFAQPLTKELASSLSAGSPKGALVSDLVEDAPAAKAGLRSGDIITEVNGHAVASPRDLVNAIGRLAPGDKANLKIARGGESEALTVRLGTRPSKAEMESETPAQPGSTYGMSLQPLSEDLARQLGTKDTQGVVVSDIEDGSPAAEAGLASGDVILEAGGRKVTSPREVEEAAANAGREKGLLLKVRQRGATRFVVVKPADR